MAQIGFSFGGPLAKVIVINNPSMTVFEILYWKSFSMLFLNYGFCRYNGVQPFDVPKQFRVVIVMRALVGYFGLSG